MSKKPVKKPKTPEERPPRKQFLEGVKSHLRRYERRKP